MDRKKIINVGIISLLVLGVLALVFFDNKWELVEPQNVVLEDPENLFEDKIEAKKLYSIEIPYDVYEKIDENNWIDAVVDVPDSIRTKGFQKAKGTVKKIDQEKVLGIIEDYYHPVFEGEDDYDIRYSGEDGMYFSFQKVVGSAYLMTDTYIILRTAYQDSIGDSYYNRELYALESDLSNFTVDECDQVLQEIYERFGIKGEVNVIHRALDYQTMEDEAVELRMDGTETKPDYDWSEDDNSYHCTISQGCNGVSVIPSWRFQSAADILNAGAHTIVLNKDRVVGLDIDDIYDIKYQQEYEDLLEFSEVLNLYKQSPTINKYSYCKEITDISLRVIPVAEKRDVYTLAPVWVFYGRWFDEQQTFEAPFAIILDAVTGEEL